MQVELGSQQAALSSQWAAWAPASQIFVLSEPFVLAFLDREELLALCHHDPGRHGHLYHELSFHVLFHARVQGHQALLIFSI